MAEEDSRELALLAVAALQVGESPRSQDFAGLTTEMTRYLRGAWPGLSDMEIEETQEAALERFLRAVTRPQVKQLGTAEALGYLLRTLRNQQIDYFRRREHLHLADVAPDESELVGDDLLLEWLDREADLQRVSSALRKLTREEDTMAVRVIFAWLDEAAATGNAPSARTIGTRLKVSHTTVGRALERFRDALEQVIGSE